MGAVIGHKNRINEHVEGLDTAIAAGIETRQATVGFHCSAGSSEMLELFLHHKGLLPTGKVVKHEWFKRPMPGQKVTPLAERMLPMPFEDKDAIFELMYRIEEHRNTLIYGRPTKAELEAVITAFRELRALLGQKLEVLGESI